MSRVKEMRRRDRRDILIVGVATGIYFVVFSALWGAFVMVTAAVLHNRIPAVPAFTFAESVIIGLFISILIAGKRYRR